MLISHKLCNPALFDYIIPVLLIPFNKKVTTPLVPGM